MVYGNLTLRLSVLAALLWTAVLGLSLVWNLNKANDQAMSMAYSEARANLNKDITFRRWGTMHGGVYVPITETQKSVPWLSHVPGRDITTADGRKLTLLNPASMLRQMMDAYAEEYGIRGRITGLKYLNPGNAPDDWERQQLEAFTRGEKERKFGRLPRSMDSLTCAICAPCTWKMVATNVTLFLDTRPVICVVQRV